MITLEFIYKYFLISRKAIVIFLIMELLAAWYFGVLWLDLDEKNFIECSIYIFLTICCANALKILLRYTLGLVSERIIKIKIPILKKIFIANYLGIDKQSGHRIVNMSKIHFARYILDLYLSFNRNLIRGISTWLIVFSVTNLIVNRALVALSVIGLTLVLLWIVFGSFEKNLLRISDFIRYFISKAAEEVNVQGRFLATELPLVYPSARTTNHVKNTSRSLYKQMKNIFPTGGEIRIGFLGHRGIGKSTIINLMLIQYLRDKKKVFRLLNFDVGYYESIEHLVSDVFDLLHREIRKMRYYSGQKKFLKGLLKDLIFSLIEDAILDAKSKYRLSKNFKNDLNSLLQSIDLRIWLIFDDVDRLNKKLKEKFYLFVRSLNEVKNLNCLIVDVLDDGNNSSIYSDKIFTHRILVSNNIDQIFLKELESRLIRSCNSNERELLRVFIQYHRNVFDSGRRVNSFIQNVIFENLESPFYYFDLLIYSIFRKANSAGYIHNDTFSIPGLALSEEYDFYKIKFQYQGRYEFNENNLIHFFGIGTENFIDRVKKKSFSVRYFLSRYLFNVYSNFNSVYKSASENFSMLSSGENIYSDFTNIHSIYELEYALVGKISGDVDSVALSSWFLNSKGLSLVPYETFRILCDGMVFHESSMRKSQELDLRLKLHFYCLNNRKFDVEEFLYVNEFGRLNLRSSGFSPMEISLIVDEMNRGSKFAGLELEFNNFDLLKILVATIGVHPVLKDLDVFPMKFLDVFITNLSILGKFQLNDTQSMVLEFANALEKMDVKILLGLEGYY